LVERFGQLSARNRKGYNEPATRQEFMLPLFRALGWNIEDTREVSPEERVSRGYVDFAFRLRGIPRFFVEMVVLVEEMLRLQREHAEAEALRGPPPRFGAADRAVGRAD
jgi:hypothetical protein